ncbi:hypothetical protein ZIOFF_040499 [Zingiber officinale]|uniref:Uncharacterized protein n=1 Tax=Zingiber officinale TaxID=94328 RepID=A0A8J5L4L1_ZINOF|nr:hypothetical protein ZIOFF_040499 [Zingiber officinale]
MMTMTTCFAICACSPFPFILLLTYRKARIEEVWKKMNSGMPLKDLKSLSWMFRLGIAPAKAPAATSTLGKRPESSFNGSMEEAKKLAAAALLAAKDAGLSTIAGRGKVEVCIFSLFCILRY